MRLAETRAGKWGSRGWKKSHPLQEENFFHIIPTRCQTPAQPPLQPPPLKKHPSLLLFFSPASPAHRMWRSFWSCLCRQQTRAQSTPAVTAIKKALAFHITQQSHTGPIEQGSSGVQSHITVTAGACSHVTWAAIVRRATPVAQGTRQAWPSFTGKRVLLKRRGLSSRRS